MTLKDAGTGLTPREALFLKYYLAGAPDVRLNGTRAILACGFTNNVKSASVMAVQELRKRSVQAAIRDFVDRSTTSIQKILTRTAHIAYTDFDEVFSWDERGNLHVIPSADLSPAAKALVGGIIQKRTIHRNRDGGEIEEVQTSGLQSVADRVGSMSGRRAATAARSLGVSAT